MRRDRRAEAADDGHHLRQRVHVHADVDRHVVDAGGVQPVDRREIGVRVQRQAGVGFPDESSAARSSKERGQVQFRSWLSWLSKALPERLSRPLFAAKAGRGLHQVARVVVRSRGSRRDRADETSSTVSAALHHHQPLAQVGDHREVVAHHDEGQAAARGAAPRAGSAPRPAPRRRAPRSARRAAGSAARGSARARSRRAGAGRRRAGAGSGSGSPSPRPTSSSARSMRASASRDAVDRQRLGQDAVDRLARMQRAVGILEHHLHEAAKRLACPAAAAPAIRASPPTSRTVAGRDAARARRWRAAPSTCPSPIRRRCRSSRPAPTRERRVGDGDEAGRRRHAQVARLDAAPWYAPGALELTAPTPAGGRAWAADGGPRRAAAGSSSRPRV